MRATVGAGTESGRSPPEGVESDSISWFQLLLIGVGDAMLIRVFCSRINSIIAGQGQAGARRSRCARFKVVKWFIHDVLFISSVPINRYRIS